MIGDLRDQDICRAAVDTRFDEVFQLAADMGGAGFIVTGEIDADTVHNSATINLNVLDACHKRDIRTVFYSSSACAYPAYDQEDPTTRNVPGTRPIRPRPTANTAGRSCSANASISPIIATMS
jgi:GDP-D-mannose 3',5'-epimerase